ncbi:MAG TPA: CoA transferase [Chloroflexota bacterium]|jgi:crotonobetainyl-CoA:carnitine CoA-transferase CaiB-like acyl-CoA transferase
MASALEGIRVIDLAQHMAGPGTSMYLADQGAEVVKIEPPGKGDSSRRLGMTAYVRENSRVFMSFNRNKKSLSLDVRTPRGQEVLFKLVERSDVLIHNLRTATAERLGLSYERLAEINPRLVYASVTAYGTKGAYADKGGYDRMTQGMGGAMYRRGADGMPITCGVWISDCSIPMMLSYGIMCALWAREKTGRGQKVETSLLQAALAMQLNDLIYVENDAGGEEDYGGPTYGVFRCGDDKFINVGALQADQFARLCRVLELDHLADDPRFSDPAESAQFRAEVFPIIEELFKLRPSREWLAVLDEVDVPCAPVLERREVFFEAQIVENEMIVPLEHPKVGPTRVLGVPLRLSATPGAIRAPAPLIGQHTDEVLRSLDYSPAEIEALRAERVV